MVRLSLKEDFYYLVFLRRGSMPHKITWESIRVGQESKGVRGKHCKNLYYNGKLLGGRIPYWVECKTQMLEFVVRGLVI